MADENKLLKSCKGRRKSRWSDVKRPPMLVAELLELLQAMPDTGADGGITRNRRSRAAELSTPPFSTD
jgi:hypothetical protein